MLPVMISVYIDKDNNIDDDNNKRQKHNTHRQQILHQRHNNQLSRLNNKEANEVQITFINYSRLYCICVIDIVNSTKITSEIIGSGKIREYYSTFLNTMGSIIKNHNGKVIKNAGDCLIYYFPKTVNGSNKSAFKDVIDCGLAMIGANSIINSSLNENDLPSISYRISGNYGIVEIATSPNSSSADLFGPTLNICSKINRLASPNEMVIHKDLFEVLNTSLENEEYRFKEIQCDHDEYRDYSGSVYSVHRIENSTENTDDDNNKRQKHNTTHQQQILHQQPQQQRQQKNKQNQANSSYNILLIDDDTDILFTFAAVIEDEGYHLKSFNNPYEALSHFSQMDPYHYDLVITDIRMPGMNGIQLYSKLKVMNPEIKILFLSALDAIEELLSIFPDLKVSEIFRKPIEPRDLISKAAAILRM